MLILMADKHRIVSFVGLLVFLVFMAWLVWPTVTLSSPELKFSGAVSNENYLVSLKNHTGSDVYAVTLSLIPTQNTTWEDYSFSIPLDSRHAITDGSRVSDVGGVMCMTPERHEFFMFTIYRMRPQEVREISVTLARQLPASVAIKIPSYKRTPIPRIDDPHKLYGEAKPETGAGTQCGKNQEAQLLFWVADGHKIPPDRINAEVHVKAE